MGSKDWENVIAQSPANEAQYKGNELPEQKIAWPENTWFRRRLKRVKEERRKTPTSEKNIGGRMKKYEVYHADPPNFLGLDQKEFPKDFLHVATVEAEDLEEVFRLTNHIDKDWTTNNGVTLTESTLPRRSTSVGDVAVDEENNHWVVAMIGWQKF